VTGTLWLWRSTSLDSSLKTGKRVAAGDTSHDPLYGATDVQMSTLTRSGESDEAALRQRTDPVYPEILVTQFGGISRGKEWSEVQMWIGSLANARDGSDGLDGAGYSLYITEKDSTGFRGRWGRAGIVMTDTGYYCATRIR
jgi:hypothetical protein